MPICLSCNSDFCNGLHRMTITWCSVCDGSVLRTELKRKKTVFVTAPRSTELFRNILSKYERWSLLAGPTVWFSCTAVYLRGLADGVCIGVTVYGIANLPCRNRVKPCKPSHYDFQLLGLINWLFNDGLSSEIIERRVIDGWWIGKNFERKRPWPIRDTILTVAWRD